VKEGVGRKKGRKEGRSRNPAFLPLISGTEASETLSLKTPEHSPHKTCPGKSGEGEGRRTVGDLGRCKTAGRSIKKKKKAMGRRRSKRIPYQANLWNQI